MNRKTPTSTQQNNIATIISLIAPHVDVSEVSKLRILSKNITHEVDTKLRATCQQDSSYAANARKFFAEQKSQHLRLISEIKNFTHHEITDDYYREKLYKEITLKCEALLKEKQFSYIIDILDTFVSRYSQLFPKKDIVQKTNSLHLDRFSKILFFSTYGSSFNFYYGEWNQKKKLHADVFVVLKLLAAGYVPKTSQNLTEPILYNSIMNIINFFYSQDIEDEESKIKIENIDQIITSCASLYCQKMSTYDAFIHYFNIWSSPSPKDSKSRYHQFNRVALIQKITEDTPLLKFLHKNNLLNPICSIYLFLKTNPIIRLATSIILFLIALLIIPIAIIIYILELLYKTFITKKPL